MNSEHDDGFQRIRKDFKNYLKKLDKNRKN